MDDKQALVSSAASPAHHPVVSQPQLGQGLGPPQYASTQNQQYFGQMQGQHVAPNAQSHTIVVSSQPQPIPMSEWSSGLGDCTEDIPSCLLECFLGPIATANIATRLGESCTYGLCCGSHLAIVARPYLRARHNIQGGLMNDCCVAAWCGPCSLCQISRELDRRGYPNGCLY